MVDTRQVTILEVEDRADPVLRGQLTFRDEGGPYIEVDIWYGYRGSGDEITIPREELPRLIEELKKMADRGE